MGSHLLRPRTALAAALLAALLAGCDCQGGPKPGEGVGTTEDGVETPGEPTGEGGTKLAEKPPAAGELDPSIRELGPAFVIPDKIVIEFARPVRTEDPDRFRERDGGVRTSKSRVKLVPEVPGSLSFTSPSTLTFVPRAGLQPETAYQVTLEAVETSAGVVEAPAPDAWKYEFKTPKFDFLRASLADVNLSNKTVMVDVVFSGRVEQPSRVKDLVSFTLDGVPARDFRVETSPEPHVVRFRLQRLFLEPARQSQLQVTVAPGAKMHGRDLRAGGGTQRLDLGSGKLVSILKVVRKEGPSGHYLEVICDDDAVPEKRYHWDPDIGDDFRISRRCMLEDAAAAEAIRVKPAVKVSVAPSQGGFRILGDFKRGSYTVTIEGGARSLDGGMLGAPYQGSFSFPARSPKLSFVSEGRYLPRKAWKSLPIQHLNVEKAELVVRQVSPQNLVFWMSDDQNEAATERTSDIVLKQKLALKSAPDAQGTTWLDVAAELPASTKGLLELTVASGPARDTARVLLTDMHLVAKRGGVTRERPWGEELWVWALGLDDVAPLSGVEVKLIKKSGQVVGTCRADGAAGCRIAVPKPELDPAEPFALVATRGDDLTYLKFKDLEVEIAEARVGGEPFKSERPYRGSIWSDRGVYRPGETAHLAAVIRDAKEKAPKQGMPLELKVIDPRSRELKKVTLTANEAGMVSYDLAFASFAPTGRYEVTLSAGDKPVARYAFQVEEFVPERMKVEAKAARDGYLPTDAVEVAVDARYLFGGIPADHPVELTCELGPSTFEPKENANYAYGVWSGEKEPKPIPLGAASGTTDEAGKARLTCPTPKDGALGFAGAAELVARAAVFESGSGRTTVGEATVAVHPERFYVGLQSGAKKAQAGKPFPVSGVVVDWGGRLAGDVSEVELELVRLEDEYGWWWDEEEGGGRHQRYQRPVVESREKVKVQGGKFSASFTPQEDASAFLVRARAGKARTDLEVQGQGRYYWYEPGESRVDVTPKPVKPTWVALELPKSTRVGQATEVKFQAPYKGRALLTAETDHVVKHEWRDVQAGEVTWSFTLPSFAPNVYVSAFVVKDPHLDSAESFMPDRAFGVQGVKVEPEAFTYAAKLEVPKELRSGTELEVKLDVGPAEAGTYATIAAVDEGILQLTRFQTPDPLSQIFTARALGVETFETVGWTLLLPPVDASRSTGGDGAGGDPGRVQPVKPVALWSGLVPVGQDGKATVKFQVPTYRGQLRVMAVAAGPTKLGRAQASVTVRDPLTLQATLPRFLSAGDQLEIPVFLTNLSGKKQEVTISMSAEPLPYPGLDPAAQEGEPILLAGKREKALSLDDGASGTVVFRARALKSVGAAKFRVVARGGGHESHEEADVPFVPASPKSRRLQRIELAGGTVDLAPYLEGWVPTTEQSTLWVTANPYGDAFDHLKYLVRYPYGCIEQTSSSTWPLLALSSLLPSVDPQLVASGKIEDMAQHGIDRILSMQTPSGGFGYWPGDTHPTEWGSAYATHLLLDATRLGYPVPKGRVDEAVAWLEGIAEKGTYDSWRGNHEPYVQYVLALAGKGKKARVQRLLDGLPKDGKGEKAEHRYMLQAALFLAGDRRYEKELKHPDTSAILEERKNGWTFYSDRRRRAFMLSTFQDLFGSDPSGETLANMVAEGLRAHASGWYTTQELSWSITGLGKRVAGNASQFGPVSLAVNGKAAKPVPVVAGAKKSADVTYALARASEAKSLTLDVGGKPDGKLFLVLSSEGVREKADWRVGGEGLVVKRRWVDSSGSELDVRGGALALGDMVFTEITVTNTTGEKVSNLALVDRFPAGWEIENPRLGRGGAVSFVDGDQLWSADYLDVRDDRLAVFGSLERGESKKVVYALRAVTSGSFVAPPVEVEAMYDPRIWAREAGGIVTVSGPWERYVD